MTKNPSRKLSEVFVLISQVIRIHISKWEAVVVCRRRILRGMRIFILIIPQVIRVQFGEWEVVVVYRHRREVKIPKDIDNLANHRIIIAHVH